MKEWYVYWTVRKGEEWWNLESHLVVLPSFWKVVWWFLRTARRCSFISIRTVLPADYDSVGEDPCESCLRWEECNGVDLEECMK